MLKSTDLRASTERLIHAVLFYDHESVLEVIPAVRAGLLKAQRRELARQVVDRPLWTCNDDEIRGLAILACRIAATEFGV